MDISIDSRTIKPGQYFIPVKGKNFDGKDYIHQAIQKGGILLDVDLKKYAKTYRKKLKAQVIAITGSAGKTTLKEMLYTLLSPHFKVVKTKKNQNNDVGVPLTLLSADFQTEIIIVECGIRAKSDMTPLVQICRPNIAIITNIHLSHMQFYRSTKQLAHAKSNIFTKPLKHETAPRFAFINKQSLHADIQIKKAYESSYNVQTFSGISSKKRNLDLCYKIGNHFGLSDQIISQELLNFRTPNQRFQKIIKGNLTIIDDSYNANPGSVLYALEQIQYLENRKILILGDMLELGKFINKAYQQITNALLNLTDCLFISFGNINPLVPPSLQHLHFSCKKELHQYLNAEIKPHDVIVIKGSHDLAMHETVSFIKNNVTT